MKKLTRGFTLIELLVVIAIIGILSAIVIAALNGARGRGADATVKSDLDSMRAQAELVYSNDGSYINVCTDSHVINAVNNAASAEGLSWGGTNSTNIGCNPTASGASYIIWVQLPKGAGNTMWWCVDSAGDSKIETPTSPRLQNTCP